MITELRIADLGVIDDATIELDPGFTVVTGETGAGKTMIVSGLSLLLGERADAKWIRLGAERARVEGRFELAGLVDPERLVELGAELDGDELLVTRTLSSTGRSRCRLGGAQVPATVCADLVSELVTIHGQAEQVRLANSDRQREILDRFAGSGDELAAYRSAWSGRRRVLAELATLRTEAQTRAREIDLLRFGLDEIEKVDPGPDEDTELAAESQRLQAVDDLRLAAHSAVQALSGDSDDADAGALTGAVTARRALTASAEIDSTLAPLAERAGEIAVLVSDLAADLSGYLADLDADPARLEAIAARRSALSGLTRKYGSTCAEVLDWARESAVRLTELEGSDDRIAELDATLAQIEAELAKRSGRLTKARTKAATALAARVEAELADLAMPHARLVFEVSPLGDSGASQWGPTGADRIDLLFSANPGTEPRPLGKVASGGELSRVRLALEVSLAVELSGAVGVEGSTLVFDEVDAGVGGRVAVEIGRRLATLAEHAQVVVVTHLAQVAAFADRHWVVVKSDDGQVTTSGVREVSDADRTGELARMMAGLDTTDSALAHAGELLELAARRGHMPPATGGSATIPAPGAR